MKIQEVEGNERQTNQAVQDLKTEIKLIQKTKTEGNKEMKNLRTLTGTSEANFMSRIQGMEERISNIEDAIEKWIPLSKISFCLFGVFVWFLCFPWFWFFY